MKFTDSEHDIDSCLYVWMEFYCKVYQLFFGKYFDFSKIEDRETSRRCKRYYIKLRDDIEQKKDFPKFKMAGDCIFNFNQKKIDILKRYLKSDEGINLLKYCAEHHHSFENFAFMPITGGMNNQKGRHLLDRPDIHIKEIQKYFNGENSNIFSNARSNKSALEWYLSLFNNNIQNYIEKVYLIDDEEFIMKSFLPFADIKVCDEDTAIQYMNLAITFWKKRNLNTQN